MLPFSCCYGEQRSVRRADAKYDPGHLLAVLLEAAVQLRAVAFEDVLLVLSRQERYVFDDGLQVVIASTRCRIYRAAGAGVLGGKQHAVGADHLEQQFQRILVVGGGVKVQALELVVKKLAPSADTPGPESAHVIRDRAPAVGHDELQVRELLEHLRVHQRDDGDAFLVDEFERVALAR